jgi:hypothetical protein
MVSGVAWRASFGSPDLGLVPARKASKRFRSRQLAVVIYRSELSRAGSTTCGRAQRCRKAPRRVCERGLIKRGAPLSRRAVHVWGVHAPIIWAHYINGGLPEKFRQEMLARGHFRNGDAPVHHVSRGSSEFPL